MMRLLNAASFFEVALRSPDTGGAGGGAGGVAGTGGGSGGSGAGADGGGHSGSAAPTSTPAGGGGQLDHGGEAGGEAPESFEGFSLDSVELDDGVGEAGEAEPEVEATEPQQPAVQPVAQPSARSAPGEITLGNIDAAFAQNQAEMIDSLAKTYFALSAEESEALIANPEQVLPQLLARGLFQALRSIPLQINKFVPGLIANQTRTMAAEASAESQFFTSWPGLRGHDGAVVHALNTIRAMKPNATFEEAIQLGGQMTCLALGLDVSAVGGGAGVAGSRRGGRGRASQMPPFRPAGSGTLVPGSNGATPAAVAAANSDPWAGFDLPNSGDA